jgi:predicted RND superfamily exporter protein
MYYTNDMVSIVHDDFSVAMIISSVFVLLVLLLSFRNFWIALLAFLPMFLSWYVVQGAMALLGIKFNLINIVISTFVFGIGVDYSIFVMRGLLAEARGEGSDLLDYHKAAIVFSAFVLVVVVLSLLFAVHPAISSIGVCTLIGMASTILITYTLQPFVFRMLLKVPFIRKSFKVKSDSE